MLEFQITVWRALSISKIQIRNINCRIISSKIFKRAKRKEQKAAFGKTKELLHF